MQTPGERVTRTQGLAAHHGGSQRLSTSERLVLATLLLVAALLRLAAWPSWSQVQSEDEVTYLHNGLNLLEGMTPAIKASPAGITTWLAWGYAAGVSLTNYLNPTPGDHGLPAQVRPYAAVDRALFEIYRDLRPLRMFVIVPTFLISMYGVFAAFALGRVRAGLPGALLAAGLMCLLPLFVEMSTQARPYAIAWAFGIAAVAQAATKDGRQRWLGTALLLALAVSSRIDMLILAPIVAWEFWVRPETRNGWRTYAGLAGATAAITVLVSPWIATSFFGVLRSIGSARFVGQIYGFSLRHAAAEIGWGQGLAVTIAVLLVGLALAVRQEPIKAGLLGAFSSWLLLSTAEGTHAGLRYHAGVLLAIVATVPLALRHVADRWPRLATPLVLLALAAPFGQSIAIASSREDYVPDNAVAWIEAHAAAGTTVFLSSVTFVAPLPTTASSERLWSQVMSPVSNQTKFEAGLRKFHLADVEIPRALSEDNLSMERGLRRRWYILGGRAEVKAPPFDLQLVGDGSPFDLPWSGLPAALAKAGGMAIWRGAPRSDLGRAVASWLGPNGAGTFVYLMDGPGTPQPKSSLPDHLPAPAL